jgi:osmotically-inducible protein OsmY
MAAATIQHANDVSTKVKREIASDPRITGLTLETSVQDGTVTLSGSVKSFAAKLYAEAAARKVAEVTEVNNRLEVTISRHEFRADKEIGDAIRYHFKWNVLIPSGTVDCVVVGGWVLLQGKVNAEYQKLEAEMAICHIAGVKGIVNDIEIAAPMD